MNEAVERCIDAGVGDVEAQSVAYSSIVGSSVMVNKRGGACVAMVSIHGAAEPLSEETSEALSALIAAAINQMGDS